MKIYLFDTETGVYQGEDFADEGDRLGSYRLPTGATNVAPPERADGILRFDPARQRWEVLPSPNRQGSGLRGRLEGNAAGENSA